MLHQKTKVKILSMAKLNTTTGRPLIGTTMRRSKMPGRKSGGRRKPKMSRRSGGKRKTGGRRK